MTWSRLARFVRAHPGRVFGLAMLILLPPAVSAAGVRLSFNVLSELPPGDDSVKGYELLAGHFTKGEVAPLIVVLHREAPMFDAPSFRAINDVTVALGKIPGVAAVRSITQPTGGVFSPEQLAEVGAADFAKFPDRLEEGATGVKRVVDGLGQIRSGLAQMRDKLPALASGLEQGAEGVVKMRTGVARMRDGIAQMRAGLGRAAGGLWDGAGLPATNECAAGARPDDLADAADAARVCLARALDTMHTVVQRPGFDPQYTPVYPDVATAYGALTGVDDTTGDPAPGAEDYARRGGLPGSLREIASGLRRAIDGLAKIDGGLRQIDEGLAKLGPGLDEGSTAVTKTVDGTAQMIAGLDRIIPGLGLLRAGLEEGAARVRSAGVGEIVSAGNLGLTPRLVESLPGLRERLGVFITPDNRTTRLFVTLEQEPYSAVSLSAVERIRETTALALRKSPLQGTPVLVGGSASFFDDIRVLSDADFRVIMVAVLLGIFAVLALLLRSIVAPVYLILTVLLSFLSTLGLTGIVFMRVLGQPGIAWWLPPFLFVMLVALGADYNIFLMSRIREETRRHTTADATARGLALTGHVITSAGLILAGTFAALMAAPLKSLQQFGFAVTAGILLDTFVVRSLLVPAIATLLGRHNWWPSRRAAAP